MKYIYFLDDNDTILNKAKKIFEKETGLSIEGFKSKDIDDVLNKAPDVIIVNEKSIAKPRNVISICRTIRSNIDNSKTPIVVISSSNDTHHIVKILKEDVELCLSEPIDDEILYYSIINIIRLLNSNRMISPLTGLPGNVQIQAEMKKRLDANKRYAMLYLDLDNFKAYNDTYGFSNGDEIIKYTARVITKYVNDDSCHDNFVGHIGGDDFVAIIEGNDYEQVCQNIITEFDEGILKYFTKEDVQRGFIEVENRKGLMEQFPIVSISIGVVDVTNERFKNVLEIGEAGASVKHLAKTIWGSTYVIDRRKNREEKKIKKINN